MGFYFFTSTGEAQLTSNFIRPWDRSNIGHKAYNEYKQDKNTTQKAKKNDEQYRQKSGVNPGALEW